MSYPMENEAAYHAFRRRIEELEQENSRLSSELEELKHAEEKSRRNETLYRMLAANLPNGGVFLVDHDLRYLLADGQAVRAAGITSGSLEGKTIWEAWDAATAARYETAFRQVLGGETFVSEHQEYNRDLVSRGVPVMDEQGQIVAALVLSYDITEHKKAEQALAESEIRHRETARLLELDQARLAAVLRDLPVGVWIADHNGRLIGSNAQADRIWAGESPLLNSTAEYQKYVAWYPDSGRLLEPEEYPVAVALRTGQTVEPVELKIRRFDGSEGTVLVSAAPVKDRQGLVSGAVGVNVDITERVKMEQELRESEKIYRAIGEAIPYGVWICDPEGRNIYASQSYLDLVGITQQQCSDFGWGDTLHPDDAERTIAAWKECARSGELWDIEHRFLGTDGQYHPILARGIPVRNEQGEVIYWAGINLDISRLRKTEQDLKVSEERLRVALKNSPMVVYTADRELRYTWVYNPTFGFDAEHMIGKTDEELNGIEGVSELVALKRSVLESGIGKREEVQLRHEGEAYFYDVTVEPVRDEGGAVTGLTVAAIDITEKKRMEHITRENQIQIELQGRLMALREQERLGIAQDIHDGPTQTLISTLLDMQITREMVDDPTLQIELNQIGLNIRNAVQELRDVIAELRPPSLQRLGFSHTLRMHAEGFNEKYPGLEVLHDIAEDQGRLSNDISLSLFRIHQEALNNVARHAAATKVHVRFFIDGDMAVLEIEDDGKGLDVIPDTAAETAQGHYGLAGMKERAEANRGELRLLSTPGKGTTVIARVPLHKNR